MYTHARARTYTHIRNAMNNTFLHYFYKWDVLTYQLVTSCIKSVNSIQSASNGDT